MNRKPMLQLLALCSLGLGALGFLAIPTHSWPSVTPNSVPGAVYVAPALPGGRCGLFDMAGSCGPNFWLRVLVFAVGLCAALVLNQLARQEALPGATSAKASARAGRAYGFRLPSSGNPLASSPVAPGIDATREAAKVCPDCAEEVRAAARKCRFCGYEFAEATASGLST